MSNYPDPGSPDPQPQAPIGGSSAAGSASAPGPDYSTPPPPPPPGAGYSYSAPSPGVGAGGPPVEALAGFWIRFGGAFIDGIIIGIVVSILGAIFGLGNGVSTQDGTVVFFDGTRALQTLLSAIYFTYLHASATGQTLGNRLLGIRVVDADTGATIPYSRSFIRYLISLLSGLALGIGYLWMLFDARKQTWHDKVANTLVVRASYYPPTGQFGRPAA